MSKTFKAKVVKSFKVWQWRIPLMILCYSLRIKPLRNIVKRKKNHSWWSIGIIGKRRKKSILNLQSWKWLSTEKLLGKSRLKTKMIEKKFFEIDQGLICNNSKRAC